MADGRWGWVLRFAVARALPFTAAGALPVVAAGAFTVLALRARSRRRLRLKGRSVLITGGSRGLGLLLAREFARRGSRVAICARDERELERAHEDLVRRGAEAIAFRCDVTAPEQVDRLVAEVEVRYGGIDVLVNNAGIIQVGPVEAMAPSDFVEVMDANFQGAVNVTLAALPGMRRRRMGRIVNITSIGGKVVVPHLLPYACSKFAFRAFSDGLRIELAGQGIAVTTVVPWLMRTGSPPNALFKGRHEVEWTLFSLSDALPLLTVDARRAARRIVRAAERGERVVPIGIQAWLVSVAQDLFPRTVEATLTGIARLLPGPGRAGRETVRGMDLATWLSPSFLTTAMNRAAIRNNEYGGRARPSRRHARRVGLGTARRMEV